MRSELWIHIQRMIRRRFRKRTSETSAHAVRTYFRGKPVCLTLILGGLMALILIGLLEFRLRPVVEHLSGHHVNNRVTKEINQALADSLSADEAAWSQLVHVERNEAGVITAVTSDMTQLNRLRTRMIETALETISDIDIQTLGIPLGSLFDADLLWAKGPVIHVRSLVSGTVSAQVNTQFEAAGINQTLHRIILDIRVPLTVLLPGIQAQTMVETSVCVAETVIVGTVPDTYLQFDSNSAGAN